MGLFGFGKKKEKVREEKSSCCCSEGCETASIEIENKSIDTAESVKVLGAGCAKCNELEVNVKKALEQLEMDSLIEHVTDFSQIASYGVMSTPALVVNGKVVSYGKVLKVEEAVKILEKVK